MGALQSDTRNALISTQIVIESSPRAFWKAINPQFSDVISKVRLLQLFWEYRGCLVFFTVLVFWLGDWRRSSHPRTCFLVLLRRKKNLKSIENLLVCFMENKSQEKEKSYDIEGDTTKMRLPQLVTRKRGTWIEPRHCSRRIKESYCMQISSTTHSFVHSQYADQSWTII